jgi:predicted RNA-binding Zn-ribbon protein involved in translation (DUF1610 family)
METLNAVEDASESFNRDMNVANESLAICPTCGETVDILRIHNCPKNSKKLSLIQNGVYLRKRTVTVFQRH